MNIKKYLIIILLIPLPVLAVDFYRPQAGDLINLPPVLEGSVVASTSIVNLNTGVLTATGSITTLNLTINGTCTGCPSGGGTADFKQLTINAVQTLTPTTTTVWLRTSSTTIEGYLNVGILTASSSAYLSTLDLGTALPDTEIASAATWNAKQDAVSATWPITLSGTTIGFNGLSTSSAAVVGNIAYFTGVNTLGNVATGTVSGTNGITVTAGRSAVGGALAIDCTVASGSAAGCLASADWTTFNGKESALTFSSPLSRSVNTISCPTCSTFAYPFISSATTSALTLSTTTISGSLNVGTLTATSGTSYLNAVTLGAALPVASGGTALTVTGTAGNVLMSSGGIWASSATATCVQITGAAGLCDGDDAGGSASPGGVSGNIQFNNGGAFFGYAGLTQASGKLGISTTTPWGALSVATTTNPIFAIATSSGAIPVLYVGATTTSWDSSIGGGARVIIGTSTVPDGRLLGVNTNLFVNGTIDQTWAFRYDSFISGGASTTADGIVNGWLNFDIGAATSCTGAPLSTQEKLRGGVYMLVTAAAAGTCHVDTGNALETAQGSAGQFTASGTPMMNVMIRFKDFIPKAAFIVGFADVPQNSLVSSTSIQSGIYFEYEPTVSANWLLVKKHAITDVGAGAVNSTTTTSIPVAANTWYDLKILYSTTTIRAYINDRDVPVTLNGSIPSRNFDWELFYKGGTGFDARAVYLQYVKLWAKPDYMQ